MKDHISDYGPVKFRHKLISYIAADGVRVTAYVNPSVAHLGSKATEQPEWWKGQKL